MRRWIAIVAASGALALQISCATPHAPTRMHSGYVYDELLADTGVRLDKESGRIVEVSPGWAKLALRRVLDLQQSLDECQTEKKALLSR
jgi:hypothetical protein